MPLTPLIFLASTNPLTCPGPIAFTVPSPPLIPSKNGSQGSNAHEESSTVSYLLLRILPLPLSLQNCLGTHSTCTSSQWTVHACMDFLCVSILLPSSAVTCSHVCEFSPIRSHAVEIVSRHQWNHTNMLVCGFIHTLLVLSTGIDALLLYIYSKVSLLGSLFLD